MVLFDPTDDGPMTLGKGFILRVAGAESNFAIGLSRLGIPVSWISRLGDDPFGDVVLEALQQEGVDTRHVRRVRGRMTGLFVKHRVAGKSAIRYYRSGSAASDLGPPDVPDEALDGIELLHLSGITMAIGDTGDSLVVDLARRARSRGIKVMFDPNWREALWPSPEAAALAQAKVLPYVDWYLCNAREGMTLFRASAPMEVVDRAKALGAGNAVVRLGRCGALVDTVSVPPSRLVEVADDVGAGDAFAAGFAFGLVEGWRPPECARAGNIMAATALSSTGDWETLPSHAELTTALAQASATNGAAPGMST